MPDIDLQHIYQILNAADIKGFTGTFTPLGGGEVNNTYKLGCTDRQLILRVAKDEGQSTLVNEARALSQLDSPHIPKLLFFDENNLLNDRMWILETFVPGQPQPRLTLEQFDRLGNLLAQVHKVSAPAATTVNLRQQFLASTKAFGDEQKLLNHPDQTLQALIRKLYAEFEDKQPLYEAIAPALIHADATPSNILVDGHEVSLIDWEFSKYNDPMADFATLYYEDIAYNQGKWRIKISPEEKAALFAGYEAGGGKIDEARIRFWIRFDKLGASVFLYWRLHESARTLSHPQREQYQLDLDNLTDTLK